MASELELINQALAALGQERLLDDLDQDPPSRPLRVARGLLPTLRDAMLRSYPWLCAMRRRSLPALVLADNHGDWAYPTAYGLPEAVLRVWMVETGRRWQRGRANAVANPRRDAILASGEGPLKVVLIERVDYADLDACLFDAMALELASRMAGPLQADKALGRALRQDAEAALATAYSVDATETGNEPPLFESAWLAARDGAIIGYAGA